MTIAEEKHNLRIHIRNLKSAYSKKQLEEKSKIALSKILNHPLYKKAKVVMLYNALPDEIDTTALIEDALKSKKVVLPKVNGLDIIPVEYTKETPLENGSFNIQEPEGKTYTGEYDLIIIPGMAFDKKGNRLGRGKGFYDRFLVQKASTPFMGVCFDFQFLSSIPHENFDRAMNEVIHS